MIAISENRVQPRQVLTVALDRDRAPQQVCPNTITAYGRPSGRPRPRKRRLFIAGWQGGASVATLSSTSNGVSCVFEPRLGIPFRMLIILCWLLDELCLTIGTISVKRGGTNW
jgi:hypothetical protein